MCKLTEIVRPLKYTVGAYCVSKSVGSNYRIFPSIYSIGPLNVFRLKINRTIYA